MQFIFFVCLIVSCSSIEDNKLSNEESPFDYDVIQDSLSQLSEQASLDSLIDSLFFQANLVDIKTINSIIEVDLKYTTTDNFTHQILYDTISKAYLNIDVANRLSLCQSFLDSIRPGYHLLVYDAVRPLQIQQEMWNALDSIPISVRGRYVSNPLFGSVHNYGAAVDLTIVYDGEVLDMGAGYDDFRPIAFPSKEKYFLEKGELTIEQVNNRKLLRKVMRSQKFYNIPSEWWHFNSASRIRVSHLYQRLLDESGNADWFKVMIPKDDSLTNLRENLIKQPILPQLDTLEIFE